MLPRHFCSPALRRRSLEPCTWYVRCEVVRCGLFTSICRPICPVEKVTGFRTGNPRFESWPGHFDAQLRRLPHAALMSCTLLKAVIWPVGLMDKASASGAGDSRFESWADQSWPSQEWSHRKWQGWATAAQWRGCMRMAPQGLTSKCGTWQSNIMNPGQGGKWAGCLSVVPTSSPLLHTAQHCALVIIGPLA